MGEFFEELGKEKIKGQPFFSDPEMEVIRIILLLLSYHANFQRKMSVPLYVHCNLNIKQLIFDNAFLSAVEVEHENFLIALRQEVTCLLTYLR